MLRVLIVDGSDQYDRCFLQQQPQDTEFAVRRVTGRGELVDALSSEEWNAVLIGQAIPSFPPDEVLAHVHQTRPTLPVLSVPERPASAEVGAILDHICPEPQRTGRSLSLLSEVLDTIPQSVFWKGINGVYLGCNRVFANDIGIASPEEVIGKTDFDLPWPAEEAKGYRAADLEVIQSGQPKRHIVERVQQADGTRIWVDTTKVPLKDEVGNVWGVLGIYEDITEFKQAQEDLWQSTQMLHLVLDTIPARVFWKDTNSVYLGCNYLFAANAGLNSPEEIAGKTDYDLPWTREESDSYREDDQQVMSTGVPKLNYEETQFTAEGRTTWVRTSKIPLKDAEGNIIGVLGTFEDITERKQAEEALQREVAVTTAMLEAARAVIVVLDRDGVILRFNRYCEEISGYTSAEAIGRHVWDFLLVEEEAEATRKAFQKSLEGPALDYFENYWRTKDGHLRRLAWSSTVVVNPEGEPEYVIGIAMDITERKRHEEEKRQFYRETIRSVTDGKLEIANASEVHPYQMTASFSEAFTNAPELSAARHRLQTHCLSEGADIESTGLFLTAVGEAMNNALKHAGGGTVFCGIRNGELWVGVGDTGPGISAITLPGATLRRGYSTKVSLGMGYSIMLDVADRVMLSTGPEGTTVIMFRNLRTPRPQLSLADLPDIWNTIPTP